MTTTFDFQDGNGPVPAHRHPNGGGWVADTARVEETAYVGPRAQVYGSALVEGGVQLLSDTRISGVSCVTYNPLHVSKSSPSKVYVLTNVIRGAWQHERIVVGVYATQQAADKQVQEDTNDGFEVSGLTIEEHEVQKEMAK